MEIIRGKNQLLMVCYSCITGRPVWYWKGVRLQSGYEAYRLACHYEVNRIHHINEKILERRSNIMRLLNACLEHLPITAELTDKQRSAVRQLRRIEKENKVDLEFYNHIIESRKRRAERFHTKQNYDK